MDDGTSAAPSDRVAASSTDTNTNTDDPAPVLRSALGALVTSRGGLSASEEIVQSWRRSLESGLRPDQVLIPPDASFDDDGLLSHSARPVLDQMVADIGDEHFALVLTDAAGRVIDRQVRHRPLAAALDDVLLAPGFVYAEQVAGTNGIGTSLSQRQVSLVTGSEHFAESLTGLVCAAAPVFDPTSGELIGAVDITSFSATAAPLMAPLIVRAARDIEQQIVDASGLADRLILQRFLQDRKGVREPAVYVGDRRLVANSAADHLVAAADEDLLRDHARRIVSGPAAGTPEDHLLRLSSGRTFAVCGEVILDGSIQVGVVLRLRTPGPANPDVRAGSAPFGWDSLTPTEWSVVEQVAAGLTNREVADQLFVSPHTVGFHLRGIYRKLEIGSRVELTRLVVEHRS